jgi:hypothetical protein
LTTSGGRGQLKADEGTVEALGTAIRAWRRDALGVLVQADAQLRGQSDAIERTRRQRTNRLSALEAALSACDAGAPDRGRLMLEIGRAREALARAADAQQEMDEIRAAFRMLERQTRASTDGEAERADADLRRRAEAIKAYRAAGVPTPETTSTGGGAPHSGTADAIAQRGLAQVRLDQIDFSDNPILDGFGKGGATRGDYRWALTTWADVVEPAVREGADRTYFEARDAERRAQGWRQTANVYDLFLGSDPIALSRRADGSFDPQSGRHRIAVARELGITHLPARLL